MPGGDGETQPGGWGAPHLAGIQPYQPGRSPEDVARSHGVMQAVKLASNECPLGPSPLAAAAAGAALATAHRYPDDACQALAERLAQHHAVPRGHIALGHGSNELIDLLCRTLAFPDAHAVIGAPSFVAYNLALRGAAIDTTVVPLRDGLHWDLDRVLSAVLPRTRIVFVDSPGNPTSTHVAAADMRAFLQAVPDHVLVVVDEAYHDFVDAADYQSALHMRSLRQRLCVLRTFSKAYGLAGLRVGYGVAPAPLWDALGRLRPAFNVNHVAQAAALAALDDEAHLQRYLALNRGERARLASGLRAWGARVAPSQANFLHVDLTEPAAPICQALERAGIIVRALGGGDTPAVRISVGTPEENDRLLAALGPLRELGHRPA